MLSLYISGLNSTVYNSSVKQIPGGSPNSTTFLGVLIFSLIIWSRSGKKHMVAFPLHPVTFPGYVFTSNTGDDTGIQLALSKDTRVGIEEFIASGKAGKPNRTTHHAFNALLRDLSLRSAFNFFTCNQSEHLWDFIGSFRLQFAQLFWFHSRPGFFA